LGVKKARVGTGRGHPIPEIEDSAFTSTAELTSWTPPTLGPMWSITTWCRYPTYTTSTSYRAMEIKYNITIYLVIKQFFMIYYHSQELYAFQGFLTSFGECWMLNTHDLHAFQNLLDFWLVSEDAECSARSNTCDLHYPRIILDHYSWSLLPRETSFGICWTSTSTKLVTTLLY
jgi:hypothetical protein